MTDSTCMSHIRFKTYYFEINLITKIITALLLKKPYVLSFKLTRKTLSLYLYSCIAFKYAKSLRNSETLKVQLFF